MKSSPTDGSVSGLVDHLFRRSAGKMVSALARAFGAERLDLAEEVVQDALLAALERWPFQGVPENPEGWLYRTARNRAIDILRQEKNATGKFADSARDIAQLSAESAMDDELGMIFMCCHPELTPDSQVALTLKTVGGLSTGEVAAAFLCDEATVAQRLVRAKRTLRSSPIPIALPAEHEMAARLESVLRVVYLMFNEGYSSHLADSLVRRDLSFEALRLGTLLTSNPATARPEAHALCALMALQASRIASREHATDESLLLENQDRSLWDRSLVARGFFHLGLSAHGERKTTYHVEAAIAACHAAAATFASTDWLRVLDLYDELLELNPSPVVELNRCVAVCMCHGPKAALEALDAMDGAALAGYYLAPATRATFLEKLGRAEEARRAYALALELAPTAREKGLLMLKLTRCVGA